MFVYSFLDSVEKNILCLNYVKLPYKSINVYKLYRYIRSENITLPIEVISSFSMIMLYSIHLEYIL